MIKKWLIIVFSVFCSLTTFVVTFNIVQNNIILEKHKEFFNNYNDYKYNLDGVNYGNKGEPWSNCGEIDIVEF